MKTISDLPGNAQDYIEYWLFGELLTDIEEFLQKYSAFQARESGAEPDAIVAIIELKAKVIAERQRYLDKLTQQTLPF